MNTTETIICRSNYDCLGNAGTIETDRDLYVYNMYEPAPWWQKSSGLRGTLTTDSSGARFTPAQL